MNSIIESLNLWGEGFLSFAWPMLWQSSLVIAVLFALDFGQRRKLRAAVRYALWLVVLLKLMLPPSLALPTSVAWWLRSGEATAVQSPSPRVSFVAIPAEPPLLTPATIAATVASPQPTPRMTLAGWVLIAWGVIGAGLFGWLCVRWRQVAREVALAQPAPDSLRERFAGMQLSANARRRVELRLTNKAMSPAVCGLLRPVVLLPRSLAENLPPIQLRAVLLHELIHLRRGDVWVNFAQTLLQVVYWWHPLLWLANARIRRVREEAVDDAVMLALAGDADAYAPTLLEVAKLAFHRPPASLGLVGILESRSALRQRIERLVNFRAPQTAKLTLTSALGIAAFALVAAPMGEAPSRGTARSGLIPPAASPAQQLAGGTQIKVEVKFVEISQTDSMALGFFGGGPVSGTNANPNMGTPRGSPPNADIFGVLTAPQVAVVLRALEKREGVKLINSPAVTTRSGRQAHLEVADRTVRGPVIDVLPAVSTDGFSIRLAILPTNTEFLDVKEPGSLVTNGAPSTSTLPLPRLRSRQEVRQVTVWDGQTVVLVRRPSESIPKNLDDPEGRPTASPTTPKLLLTFVTATLVDAAGNPVHTDTEMSFRPTSVPNQTTATQITIETKFLETPSSVTNLGVAMSNRTVDSREIAAVFGDTNNIEHLPLPHLMGVIGSLQFREILGTLGKMDGVVLGSSPTVTTLSGRPAQIGVIGLTQKIVKSINPKARVLPGVTSTNEVEGIFITDQVGFGPVLDINASILPDGTTIELTVLATVTEFLGYDAPREDESVQVYVDGKVQQVKPPHPRMRVRTFQAKLQVQDGQTLVLGKPDDVVLRNDGQGGRTDRTPGSGTRNLWLFITPMSVTPEEPQLHPDEEFPDLTNSFPARPNSDVRPNRDAVNTPPSVRQMASVEGPSMVPIPATTQIPLGPVLDVLSTLSAKERSVQLAILPTITEFLNSPVPTNPVPARSNPLNR